MASLLFPGAQRPSTAVAGLGDVHDDNVYSAGVLAHGGTGTMKLFVTGQGSPIPVLSGTAITAAAIPAHYQTYTPVTTVIEQSGQLGNSIGDAVIRAMGVTIDLAAVTQPTGAVRAWGATPFEVKDILSKTRLELKLSNKRRVLGPTWTFPQLGGAMGYSSSSNESTIQNGMFPTGRRLRSNIEIARTDVLVAELTADAALAFSQTSFVSPLCGQATLVWVNLLGTLRTDVR